QLEALRKRADLLLREPSFSQRSNCVMLLGCALPRTKVALVVEVLAVSNVLKIQCGALTVHHGEQFVLAIKAARGIILRVLWPRHLVSHHDLERYLPVLSKFDCELQFTTRQTGRVGEQGKHALAKHLMRRPGEKDRVGSARVCDQKIAECGEAL